MNVPMLLVLFNMLQMDIMIIACHHITYCVLVEKGEGPYMKGGAHVSVPEFVVGG